MMSVFSILLLLATAFLATMLYVLLKYFDGLQINKLHFLTSNYITASIISFSLNFEENSKAVSQLPIILLPCLATGLLFILVFYSAAQSAAKYGLAITSLAAKLSMVIPIVAGFILYSETITSTKIIGILIALIAVYSTNYQKEKEGKIHFALLPILLFIGSGLVDTLVKVSQHYFINGENRQLYISMCFGAAGLFGLIVSIYSGLIKKNKLAFRSIYAGILLGTVNYFSLDFLIRFLTLPGIESSYAFAMINMLVVIMSAAFAFFLFKEQPKKSTLSGILLALLAISILSC